MYSNIAFENFHFLKNNNPKRKFGYLILRSIYLYEKYFDENYFF